jgi:hypothetical protein
MTCLIKKKDASSPRGQMRDLERERVGVVTSHGTIVMILVSFVPWGEEPSNQIDSGSRV